MLRVQLWTKKKGKVRVWMPQSRLPLLLVWMRGEKLALACNMFPGRTENNGEKNPLQMVIIKPKPGGEGLRERMKQLPPA